MATPHAERTQTAPRRPARDLIDAILQSMQENLEELKFSTLAPSRYLVYVHPREFARLEGILPHVRDEAIRALTQKLEALNRRSRLGRYKDRLMGARTAAIQNAGSVWQVEFLADPDESLAEGDILVESVLVLPARPDLGVGGETRRIATRHTASNNPAKAGSHAGIETVRRDVRPGEVLARLVYEDADGPHTYDMAADTITVGRGGSAYPVDVRIASSPDISREHARIRRNPETGQFVLIDLSSLGTTLNGRHVPRGFDDAGGTKRENGASTPLPDRARIGLADTVFLDFQVSR